MKGTAEEERKKQGKRDWGEGLEGQEEGECSLPVQRCRPRAQVNHPPFPLLDVKSPFHPDTLLNCCKNHL